MQSRPKANTAGLLGSSAEEGQGVGRNTKLLREMMVNGGVDLEAHVISMFDLPLNLPVELFMRLLKRTLHLCIHAKTHVIFSFSLCFCLPNSLSLHLTTATPNHCFTCHVALLSPY